MTIPITDNGFLDSNVNSVVSHINHVHSEILIYCKSLNNLSHRSIFSAKVSKENLQEILLAALFHKSLTAYQAVVLLVERGMPSEAQIVLRTLIEITFKIVAIAKDAAVGIAYMNQDELHRKKSINKLKMLQKSQLNALVDNELEDVLSTVSKYVSANGIKDLKTYWFAEKAGLLDFYNSAYSVLSDSVHVNVRHIEGVYAFNFDGEMKELRYGYSDKDVVRNSLTAAESLLLCLDAVLQIIPLTSTDEIQKSHDEFRVLIKKYNPSTV